VPLWPNRESDGPGRTALGLPEDVFVCLTAFDMRSSLARKNPLGALHAFQAAFGDDPKALLILKTHGFEPAAPQAQELTAAAARQPNVRIVNDVISRTGMHHLIQAADVVISLHRAEGLGLLAAEAMTYGRAVLATGWSGNMDFMDTDVSMPVGYRLVPVSDCHGPYHRARAWWAEPNLDDAVAKLRLLRQNPGLRTELGLRAADRMQSLAVSQRYIDALGEEALMRMSANPGDDKGHRR